ncbi:WhiB family transcriptional regulator (plasmid) [Microtetraspora malaysiensis]|uniref:WhiB family transcriptional regulator n=1 Tax=Microtetraspora malaysiensis TaxID=161358 RepID=UPI003D948D4D
MSSHIVASPRRGVTSAADRQRDTRLRELDALLLTDDAVCRQSDADPDDWFPIVERANPAKYKAAYEAAKKRCSGCPFTGLVGPCIERARLLPYDPIGVIAGTDPKLRRKLCIGANLQDRNGVAA